ncbi:hypothetical protein EW026_g3870 [Hermanssonia centrifuga]|uniref:Class E vacuolar protein-sorting machinery protein HSE1 n=1 Tax=Hermanssonia centrifuga TaxID=98765 RepID=A0A4S4KK11_9APHY|nr:hypothetical protein EW026_g3870 [Hermanssonia centrifuga]
MFRGGQPNPYDEIVAKTTDENLTSENWELILNLCDKVQDEGESGARNVIAAILKRLTHRTSNVQLYTLTLAESLTKNCGIEVHREIASRAFTQGLERLVLDRNTHDKVRRRVLGLVAEWTDDFSKDPTLGLIEECHENLKSKGYKFDAPNEPPPPDVDDEIRRKEEEELQRVLEMSVMDKGGRGQWGEYSLASSSGTASPATRQPQSQQPIYGGYVPSSNPTVSTSQANTAVHTPVPPVSAAPYSGGAGVTTSPVPSMKSQDSGIPIVTRVRALHTFEPTEAGELAFEKGEIIKVVDRGYKDWWRGQLKGRTGIFPVNYVEPLPEPTAAELAKEVEQEAAVFSQAANVDRLLTMLRQMDPAKDNLADDEDIQELYRSCMSLRPKIVKLIDKYSQKRADLVSMNETFVKARTIFDRMMEDSLARHSSTYDPRAAYAQPYPRPNSGARVDYPPPQAFGWNPSVYDQPGYAAYPAPPAAYAPGPEPPFHGGPQPYPEDAPYPPQGGYPPQPYGAPPSGAPTPYAAPPQAQGYPAGQPPQQQHVPQASRMDSAQVQVQPATQPMHQAPVQQHQQPQQYVQQPQGQPQPTQYVQQQPQGQLQPQSQLQPQPQSQSQPQSQPQPQSQSQSQSQSQPQQSHQPTPQLQTGPPYVYDPNMTYPDPNVQAWAQYYAQGGTDPTGALYFISVPGVKEDNTPPAQGTSPENPSQATPQQHPVDAQSQGYQAHNGPLGPAGQEPFSTVTSSLNVHHTNAHPQPSGIQTVAPGSPTTPHSQAPQSFYQSSAPPQATAGEINATSGNLTTVPAQSVPYGASPYPPQEGYVSPPTSPTHVAGAAHQGWPAQYNNLPNQFASMDVGGGQGVNPGQQGVGTPA